MEKITDMPAAALAEYEFDCACGRKHHTKARVLYGPYAEIFKKLLPVLAPSSKAALISSRDAFLADGGNWMTAIRGGGARPLNVVVTKRFDNALENIGGLFSLPDDVRAVIVCESELYDVASYFAALKNLPIIYLAVSPEAENMLSPVVSLKIKKRTERIFADNARFVAIDTDILSRSKAGASAFASLASGIVSLVDYRVRGAFTGEYCSESYNLARAAISEAVNAAFAENAQQKLLEARIRLAVAEVYTEGRILSGGEYAVAELLESAGRRRLAAAERKFVAALKLIELYGAFFAHPRACGLRVPDYAARAKEAAEFTGRSETEILGGILKSAAAVNGEKTENAARQMSEELAALERLTGKFAATYRALGGDADIFDNYTPGELRRAVFCAPDLPDTFSVLTLMRESGALELLRASEDNFS